MMTRREWLLGGLAFAAGGLALAELGLAAPAPAEPPTLDPEQRRLAARLELHRSYAKRTTNLLARYTSERASSLLQAPLVNSGQLAFVAGDRLVLRDDGATGSTTILHADLARIELQPNDPSLPTRSPLGHDGGPPPALRWLAAHLLACFAPPPATSDPLDGGPLLADARSEAPKGAIPRLVILPKRGSPVRLVLRSVTLTLDPVGGGIQRIVIAEADGGEFRLGIVEPQQNVEPEALARVLQG
jgi:hypothetical protein